ncbi:uncharacterized protein LOC111056949 isoform X1 [Nilaparvata lugens]|uniref:uncharacterized protein LOC111056949 isoform X1 n=1 Tax=Nilaparvata lugens TaxID=108931 RepID=UPI00193CECEC|nr:uncharacterized protein LOC111056949 isoform X1 [Nilaparvata lugens]
MSLNLDPREVLEHLSELGYSSISPDQLKEFISDLKKLIKYDVRVLEKQMEEERKLQTLQVPHSHRSCSPSTTTSYGEGNVRTSRSRKTDKGSACIDSQPQSYVTSTSQQMDSVDLPSKEKVVDKFDRRCVTSAGGSKENVAPSNRPGFIRPWKLCPGSQKPGAAVNRCDPVALYHHYQQYWRQNRVPGESAHSNLRWNVRERMLGQSSSNPTHRNLTCKHGFRCRCSNEVQETPKNEKSEKYCTRFFEVPFDENINVVADISYNNG